MAYPLRKLNQQIRDLLGTDFLGSTQIFCNSVHFFLLEGNGNNNPKNILILRINRTRLTIDKTHNLTFL